MASPCVLPHLSTHRARTTRVNCIYIEIIGLCFEFFLTPPEMLPWRLDRWPSPAASLVGGRLSLALSCATAHQPLPIRIAFKLTITRPVPALFFRLVSLFLPSRLFSLHRPTFMATTATRMLTVHIDQAFSLRYIL